MSDKLYKIRIEARRDERVFLRGEHLKWHVEEDSNPSENCHTCVLLDEPDSN